MANWTSAKAWRETEDHPRRGLEADIIFVRNLKGMDQNGKCRAELDSTNPYATMLRLKDKNGNDRIRLGTVNWNRDTHTDITSEFLSFCEANNEFRVELSTCTGDISELILRDANGYGWIAPFDPLPAGHESCSVCKALQMTRWLTDVVEVRVPEGSTGHDEAIAKLAAYFEDPRRGFRVEVNTDAKPNQHALPADSPGAKPVYPDLILYAGGGGAPVAIVEVETKRLDLEQAEHWSKYARRGVPFHLFIEEDSSPKNAADRVRKLVEAKLEADRVRELVLSAPVWAWCDR